MQVELLVVPGCPGADAAKGLLRRALDDLGLAATPVTVVVVDSEAAARARGFAGSPAFVVDGSDLFGRTAATGSLSCRVYATPDGPRNVPRLADLRRALSDRHVGR